MDLQFVQVEGDSYGFRHEENGELLAEITWTMLGDVMAVDSTYVSPKLRGGGVAKQLVDRAAEYAREHGYKMEPICSYVVAAFERYKEYDDVKI